MSVKRVNQGMRIKHDTRTRGLEEIEDEHSRTSHIRASKSGRARQHTPDKGIARPCCCRTGASMPTTPYGYLFRMMYSRRVTSNSRARLCLRASCTAFCCLFSTRRLRGSIMYLRDRGGQNGGCRWRARVLRRHLR